MSVAGTPQGSEEVDSLESSLPAGCFLPRIRTPHTIRRLNVEATTTAINRNRGPGAVGRSRAKERHLQWKALFCPSTQCFTHTSRLSSSVNFSMLLSPLILDKSNLRAPKKH